MLLPTRHQLNSGVLSAAFSAFFTFFFSNEQVKILFKQEKNYPEVEKPFFKNNDPARLVDVDEDKMKAETDTNWCITICEITEKFNFSNSIVYII